MPALAQILGLLPKSGPNVKNPLTEPSTGLSMEYLTLYLDVLMLTSCETSMQKQETHTTITHAQLDDMVKDIQAAMDNTYLTLPKDVT